MPENHVGVQAQCPALIIGLGGTGKQVLLNFRRMYYERYGSKHPPYVGHLWIDTDSRNVLLDGREMDFLMNEVNFNENEKVSVELKKADLQNFYDNSSNHPHIFSWFDKRLEKHGHITNGAGAIRSFGRLAFFRYYDQIMAMVRDMHGKISNVATHIDPSLENKGIVLDGGALDIWLIFSVAGGTGSGMFLDLAFALRERWPNVNIRSIILLPSVFSNEKTNNRFFGNAYAALMELEHYGYSRSDMQGDIQEDLHRFPLAWTRGMYEQRNTLPGPVFDTSYLIDNAPASNAGHLAINDKNALCRMIAEWLYIEYGTGADVGGIGAERRAKEVNFSTELNRIFSHKYELDGLEFAEVFSCRYSSFGLSKLYIPVDRVEMTVQYRLVEDLIKFWTIERPLPANLDELIETDYLHNVGINNNTSQRDFIRALDTGGTGERLMHRLEKLVLNNKGRFLGMASSPQVRQQILDWMQEIRQSQLDRNEASTDHWGSISKSIHQNRDDHYKKVTDKLQKLVTRLLSEPKYRFDVLREVLRRMRDRLSKDVESFQRMEEKHRQASQNASKQAQNLLQWLDDVKGNFTRKAVIQVALEQIELRMKRELQAQIAGVAAKLAEQVADYIGRGVTDKNAQGEEMTVETGLIKQVMEYRGALKNNVLGRLNERIRSFDKIEISPIYQEISDGVQETDRFYVDQQRRPISESTLAELEKRLFESYEEPKDLWDMRRTLKQGENKLIQHLLDFANQSMRHVKEMTVDAIERLTEHYPSDSPQYSQKVGQLLNYAHPWLPEPNQFVPRDQVLNERKYAHWVARTNKPGSAHYIDFEQEVNRQNNHFRLLETSPDRVYAASEVAGFPLMVIPDLDRYRNDAYRPLLERGEVLHTDLAFEKFQDLLIKGTDEVKSYIETLGIFLQALLLGIIHAEQGNQNWQGSLMRYRYVDDSQIFPETIDLGPFSVAVARLARRREEVLLQRIQQSVIDAINCMNDETLIKWCGLLTFHAGGGREASYFYRFASNHVVRAILRQRAESLIRDNGNRMREAARTNMENLTNWALHRQGGQQIWAIEKPERSGIYILESWR